LENRWATVLGMQQEYLGAEPVVKPLTAAEKSEKIRQAGEIAQAHHFVFLGGLHRSGTTLLFRMLREHPAISGFANNQDANEWLAAEDEGQYLQSVYPQAIYWGGPGKFAFAPEAHLTEQSELLTVENKAKLAIQWFPYWDLSKHFLLEKSPPNLIWTRFLQSAFPNSSFVIIERHPVAVSLATEKWSPTGLVSLVEHWLVAHETFEKDRAHLRRGFIGAARILEAAGAQLIFSPHAKWCAYEPGRNGSLDSFTQAMDEAGWDSGRLALFSFHIMGSARLGGSPKVSATNPDGQTWEVDNLFVMDGSSFPSASGVNPMISIEAMARRNALALAGRSGV